MYEVAVPAQPLKDGVIVIVEVTGAEPLLTAVNDGILPVPEDARPIELLELVHE